MKIFQNLSIKNKLVVIVLTAALLSITLGSAFVIYNNIQTFKDNMVSSTDKIAQFLAEACGAPLSFDYSDEVLEELGKLKGMPIVENGCVYDEEGGIYKSYNKSGGIFTPPPPKEETSIEFKAEYLHVFRPILFGNEKERIGTLYIRASTALLTQKINRYLRSMIIGFIGLVVLTYLLAVRLQRFISQPILKLADVTGRIKEEGDYSIRVRKEGEDEIGALYTGFNDMLEKIQVREKQRDEAMAEQQRLMSELADKNKELEQVVYVTSHDLRSPLVNIQGFSKELNYSIDELSSLLKSEGIPADVKEKFAFILGEDMPDSLKYILSSTAKMDSLLSGLLKLSRVGRTATTMGDIDMNELISEINNAFEFHFKDAGVDFTMENLPSCFGNDVELNQMFSNLVSNALKYLDPKRPGKISITGRQENNNVIYCIEDNGLGIEKEYQEKIFKIFHRLNPDDTQGEGLGLTIVNKIVSRHNGKIWVESEPGKGSRFFISLFAAKANPPGQ
jgi:signal transduction histidine kinase